jgi:hypothetical protein
MVLPPQVPRPATGLIVATDYLATRSFDRLVPIALKAASIPALELMGKNWPVSAQYFRTSDSASPVVLT